MVSVIQKTLGQLLFITRSPLAWTILLSSTSYVLWDWGPVTTDMWAFSILYFFMVVLIFGLQDISPKNMTNVIGGKPTLSIVERQEFLRKWNFIVHFILSVLFLTVVFLFTVILSYRENWETFKSAFEIFLNFARILFPGVVDIPQRMAAEGFTTRFEVTQMAAAIGYSMAAFCAFFAARATFKLRKAFSKNWHLANHVVFLFLSPVALFVLCALTFVMLDDAGVDMTPRPKEVFGAFEASDLSLHHRMLFQPMINLCPLGVFWGLFVGYAWNSLAVVFCKVRNKTL